MADAKLSLKFARRALGFMKEGVLSAPDDVLRCDDHLATLQLLNDEDGMRIQTIPCSSAQRRRPRRLVQEAARRHRPSRSVRAACPPGPSTVTAPTRPRLVSDGDEGATKAQPRRGRLGA
ncbi:hypothetical protein GCM10010468_04090 [Actinocorallia longicatena]|uniref:Uncharacterized protein n=1 Tax=Actinocorallia longicatena TaxID=111803 RepID=A0ABP6PWV0_9ACTN